MSKNISKMIEEMNAIVAEGKISLDKTLEMYVVEYPPKGTFEVSQVSDGWHCTCQRYGDDGICEHILAVNVAPQIGVIEEPHPPRRTSRRPGRPGGRPRRRETSGRGSREGRTWERRPPRRNRDSRPRRKE